ncbi:hypothetical protein Dip518_001209 [Parelusimicrobium proximum]|uniref:hypothetical protein n=1 Tax=Parelusimicrobium proximum TaxID=3228953 RepID=UPI003D180E5E
MTIRRIFWIALVHFAVMVCFPHFAPGGFSFGIMSFVFWSVVAVVITVVTAIFLLDRWHRFQSLVTAILIVGSLLTMMLYLPQESKVSPVKKIAYGDFPTMADVDAGLKNFNIDLKQFFDYVKNAQKKSGQLKDGVGRADRALRELGE